MIACGFLGSYSPHGLSWGSNQRLPERAKKFFSGDKHFPGSLEDYRAACETLANSAGHVPSEFVTALADHMAEIIEETNSSIDLIATGAPNPSSRDQVTIDSQTWPLAFSEEGKKFMAKSGWQGVSIFELVDWLARIIPSRFSATPSPPGVQERKASGRETSPHRALKKYRNFMDQTAAFRENINEAALQVDAYIEGQIERALLERRR